MSKYWNLPAVLDLELLVRRWERLVDKPAPGIDPQRAADLLGRFRRVPELQGSISDYAVLERHRALVDELFSLVFAPATWESDIRAAVVPFTLDTVIASPRFAELAGANGDNLVHPEKAVREARGAREPGNFAVDIFPYVLVLRYHYGLEVNVNVPFLFDVPVGEDGLIRVLKIDHDQSFCTIEAGPEAPRREDLDIEGILTHLGDVDYLHRAIPLPSFLVRGFLIANATDVTSSALAFRIQSDLIAAEAMMNPDGFRRIQANIQSIIGKSDVFSEVSVFHEADVYVYGITGPDDSCAPGATRYPFDMFTGSLFHRAIEGGRFVVEPDILRLNEKTAADRMLLDLGVRSIAACALVRGDQVLGTFSLSSSTPGRLSEMDLLNLEEVVGLLAVAAEWAVGEIEERIQREIQARCTAIHPVVGWRFRQAALKLLTDGEGDHREMEPISFEHVHPLYAATDIRGSSTLRAAAIQGDLLEQLDAAAAVVTSARNARDLPVLDELLFRISRYRESIADGLSSGEEIGAVGFLRREVEPTFDRLSGFDDATAQSARAYRERVDPEARAFYRRRRDFDESVGGMNRIISAYLDRAEAEAQAMWPHYFDKQTTDGVDMSLYIGASLLESGDFDALYLRNIRLWQLITMCRIASLGAQARETFAVPLELTHLIVVQNLPITVGFQYDEKRFHVEGAYNIRYEIIKKRIDKATIRGTEERLTQPGRLAVVCSHGDEAAEYERYFDYLEGRGLVEGPVESLELEDLQGIRGLFALRVSVNLEQSAADPSVRAMVEEFR